MSLLMKRKLRYLLQQYRRVRQRLDFRDRQLQNSFKQLRSRFYRDYWQQVSDDLGGRLEDLGSGFYRIHYKGKFAYVNGYYVPIDDFVSLRLAGRKALSQQLLQQAGLPIPQHITCTINELDKAEQFLTHMNRPVVVKPTEGGGGTGVTTGITRLHDLRKAIQKAATTSTQVLIEEQIEGDNYRLLYIDGELVDIIRRDRPTIIGDGHQSIVQLINDENTQRISAQPYTALSALKADQSMDLHLHMQGLTRHTKPGKGEIITIKGSINQNSRRDNHRIFSTVHPDYCKLGQHIRKVLDIKLLGVDIITPSLEVAIQDSGGAINEINTTPGLHHHYLVAENEQRCPAGQLALEYYFRSLGSSAVKQTDISKITKKINT